MTRHTPAHPARQHWLSVGGSNYSDKDHFPDIGTTQYSLALLITNTTTLPMPFRFRKDKGHDLAYDVKIMTSQQRLSRIVAGKRETTALNQFF
jgi:hypothetical protein